MARNANLERSAQDMGTAVLALKRIRDAQPRPYSRGPKRGAYPPHDVELLQRVARVALEAIERD